MTISSDMASCSRERSRTCEIDPDFRRPALLRASSLVRHCREHDRHGSELAEIRQAVADANEVEASAGASRYDSAGVETTADAGLLVRQSNEHQSVGAGPLSPCRPVGSWPNITRCATKYNIMDRCHDAQARAATQSHANE